MSSTSKRAFDSTRPYMPNKRERIYRFIKSKGAMGATADEFYQSVGQTHTGNGTLFYDLDKVGFIKQRPVDGERMTRTRRMAVVYVATDKEVTEGCFANPYYAHLHPPKNGPSLRGAAVRVIEGLDKKDRELFNKALADLRSALEGK